MSDGWLAAIAANGVHFCSSDGQTSFMWFGNGNMADRLIALPNQRYVVLTRGTGRIQIYSRQGGFERQLSAPDQEVTAIAATRAGRVISGSQLEVRIWGAEAEDEPLALRFDSSDQMAVSSLTEHPSGQIIIGFNSGVVHRWDPTIEEHAVLDPDVESGH